MIALPPGAAQGGSFVIYLDYSANAPVDERVLAAFCDAERGCIGNANSAHVAGQQARLEMERAVASIAAGAERAGRVRVGQVRLFGGEHAVPGGVRGEPRSEERAGLLAHQPEP